MPNKVQPSLVSKYVSSQLSRRVDLKKFLRDYAAAANPSLVENALIQGQYDFMEETL